MFTVGVVGGGFSGLLTTYHLLKNSEQPLEVLLFNSGYPTGQGIAYSTKDEIHLLNVPAGKMSALPEDPDHFLRWLNNHYPSTEDRTDKFISRKLYGEYLKSILDELILDKNNNLIIIDEEVVDINKQSERFIMTTAKDEFKADTIVLATGNLLPAELVEFETDHYIKDPWHFDILKEKADKAEKIFIVGSGLSMIDIILSLEKMNIRKPVVCMSSNGLLPKRHISGKAYPSYLDELNDCTDINSFYAVIKKHLKGCEETGYSKQSVIDVVRPYVQEIWLKLDETSRNRFLRHLKHGWNVLRHRIPASTADVVDRWINEGRLKIIAGKIKQVNEKEEGLDITIKVKHNGEVVENACLLINCTGPLMNYNKVSSTLYRNLFRRSFLHTGSLGLGLNALSTGELIDGSSQVIKDIYTLGPALKSTLWETTAVNEIRNQAKRIAKEILIDKGLIS
jgi:uncharacterized NAD(P)/FAD-binding protein YdhS